jgi:hypothetical protein
VGRRPGAVSGALELGLRDAATIRGTKPAPASPLGRDWAVSLGTGASTGSARFPQFPAKFTFDISHQRRWRDRDQRGKPRPTEHRCL